MAEEDNDKGGIFRDVNAMSVVAPALAAATSFALISRIGLVGSLIGTAITAAVSAAATQVFKNMMADSANRIQELMPDEETLRGVDVPTMTSVTSDAGMTVSTTPLSDTESDSPANAAGPTESTAPLPDGSAAQADTPQSSDATVVMTSTTGVSSVDATTARAPVAGESASLTSVTGTPLADAHARQVAAARHARELRRKLTLFSAVVAVVVALAVAGVIAAITAGKGLGPTIVVTAADDDDAQTTGTEGSDGAQVGQTPDATTSTSTSAETPADTSDSAGTDAGATSGSSTGTTEQETGASTDSTTGNSGTGSTTGADDTATGSSGTSTDGGHDTGTSGDTSGDTTTDVEAGTTGTMTESSGTSTTAL